jgi:hypothetical protein
MESDMPINESVEHDRVNDSTYDPSGKFIVRLENIGIGRTYREQNLRRRFRPLKIFVCENNVLE